MSLAEYEAYHMHIVAAAGQMLCQSGNMQHVAVSAHYIYLRRCRTVRTAALAAKLLH